VEKNVTDPDTVHLSAAAPARAGRLTSLDAFRGITIAGMILVNNPGDGGHVYPALLHAEWHGWTPTDLIFPFFLFIVGVAMPYSFSRRIEQGASKGRLLLHILYRSAVLIALGMLLTGLPDYNFGKRLFLDVLQRIGLVYLFSGAIFLYTKERGQALIAAACIIIYWALMMLLSVPGYGAGVLTWEGSLWGYVDRVVTAGWHEHGEGILSLIPSVSTVLLGSLTGYYLRSKRGPYEKVAGLFVFGNLGLVLGAIMNMWFPINKLLWSSSYVVFTAGFALNLLGVCYWLIDIKGYRRWSTPFIAFGMNAIAAFFLSSLTGRLMGLIKVPVASLPGSTDASHASLKGYLYSNLFAPLASQINSSLLWAIVYVLIWLGVMSVLYRRKIFVKI